MNEKRVDAKYKYFLVDMGDLMKEEALDAKAARDTGEFAGTPFTRGVAIAYRQIVTFMQAEAKRLDIPLIDLKLHDIDPDRDLI